jgi:3-isopropylmalate dehydratase small subunit
MANQSPIIEGKVVPLVAQDVDTDQILPSEYLKVIEKKGIGKYLFYRWRYDQSGKTRTDFVLNRPEFRGGKILVAGKNFGIGSSRENAVWALVDFGFGCVIAPSFGDIFRGNAERNRLLCVRADEETVSSLQREAGSGKLECSISIERQTVSAAGLSPFEFQMDPLAKQRFLSGVDDIQRTLARFGKEISSYESSMPTWMMPRADPDSISI